MKNCHHPARSQSALQTSGAERDGNEYFFCPHIGITFLLREHMQSIWYCTLRFAVRRLQICILITASATASRTIGLSCCVAYTSVYQRIVWDSSRLHGHDGHCKLYLANINKHSRYAIASPIGSCCRNRPFEMRQLATNTGLAVYLISINQLHIL